MSTRIDGSAPLQAAAHRPKGLARPLWATAPARSLKVSPSSQALSLNQTRRERSFTGHGRAPERGGGLQLNRAPWKFAEADASGGPTQRRAIPQCSGEAGNTNTTGSESSTRETRHALTYTNWQQVFRDIPNSRGAKCQPRLSASCVSMVWTRPKPTRSGKTAGSRRSSWVWPVGIQAERWSWFSPGTTICSGAPPSGP